MQPATPQWIQKARIELGNRIRDARLHADLTQEKLAEMAGVDRTTLQNTEAGKTDPKFSQLLRLARALRLPVRDLLP
ncbi:helix-turn-helix transcriptional regulator [Streptomyces sp. H27-H1]|uniref:helix-turn-helix transcriptional regulator n=1 Tax=Streptomyces sp. H27-H1 TaxID=2996461 RepID=UPI00227217C4|nr:helix-turn-helix transcriptional regulator [Streptomyces sp. H27-H1]MCY0928281.1 helix-turn-helix transcriptional regulator [Streptomyces sp. H27-H1]